MDNNKTTKITIPTGMYSADAAAILETLVEMLKHQQYYQALRYRNAYKMLSVSRAPDGEAVFELAVPDSSYEYYHSTRIAMNIWLRAAKVSYIYEMKNLSSKQLADIRSFIGWKIKDIVFSEPAIRRSKEVVGSICAAKHCTEDQLNHRDVRATSKEWDDAVEATFWNENSMLRIMCITDSNVNLKRAVLGHEAFEVVLLLLGKKRLLKRYAKQLTNVIGQQRDVIATEAEASRRDMVAQLNAEYDARIIDECDYDWSHRFDNANSGKVQPKAFAEFQRLKSEYKKACDVRRVELEEERLKKIAELNETFACLES